MGTLVVVRCLVGWLEEGGWTDSVGVLIIASRSTKEYTIAMEKANAVTNPVRLVLRRASGTAVAAFEHSSARWMAPSMPAYMKLGLASPVRKTIPSELHPESLTKLVHANELELWLGARAAQVMVMIMKRLRETTTIYLDH